MSIISLIAAIDEKNGLGKDNQLLCHLPADLKHFKNLTLGKPIIMGRKTFQSIGRPLPQRDNIVLSKTLKNIEGVTVFASLSDAIASLQEAKEIMIIGGADVFKQALPLAKKMYLTLIHHTFAADTFFPPIDHASWQCVQQVFQPKDEKNSYDLTFKWYEYIA